MNTNSIPETQTAKAKDDVYIFGDRGADYNDKYALFTLPKGHVVYVVDRDEDGHWSWFEEHVNKTEIQMGPVYNKMIVYTEEGNKYAMEVNAFMTAHGAYAASETSECIDMQQRDIEHLNELLNEKEREAAMVELQDWSNKQTDPYD